MVQIISRKIKKFKEYLDKLKPHLAMSVKDLLDNEDKRLAMERLFQLMVDEAIDINTSIIIESGKSPESYKSTFYDLADLHLLDRELAIKLADSAKVRNQLVHDYEMLQHSDLIESIKKFAPLYEEYAKAIINKVLAADKI